MEAIESQWHELMKTSISNNFPDEIVILILSMLPVMAILRFKCVSKSWYALLSNPIFIKLHLDQAATNNSCFLLKYMFNSRREMLDFQINQYLIDIGEDNSKEIYSLRSNDTFEEFGRIDMPFISKTNFYQIVDSVHGLICMVESCHKSTSKICLDTFLWNPAIGEFRCLPDYHGYIHNIKTFQADALGFAFDAKNNDYKVVRIDYFLEIKTYKAFVYSLNTDRWRKINANIQVWIQTLRSGTFMKGALHWVGAKQDEKKIIRGMILAFNVSEEKFSEMKLPKIESDDHDFQCEKSVLRLEDSLSLFVYKPLELGGNYDIWVMKEYGVESSWIKRSSVDMVEVMKPFCFFDGGEVVTEHNNGELVLWDIDFTKFKKLQVYAPARVVKYSESLVSTKGGIRYFEHPTHSNQMPK